MKRNRPTLPNACPTCGGLGFVRTRKGGRQYVRSNRFLPVRGHVRWPFVRVPARPSMRVYWPPASDRKGGLGRCPDPWHERHRLKRWDEPTPAPPASVDTIPVLDRNRRGQARSARHRDRQGKDRR